MCKCELYKWHENLVNACKWSKGLFGCEVGGLVLGLEEDWSKDRGVQDHSFWLFCKE